MSLSSHVHSGLHLFVSELWLSHRGLTTTQFPFRALDSPLHYVLTLPYGHIFIPLLMTPTIPLLLDLDMSFYPSTSSWGHPILPSLTLFSPLLCSVIPSFVVTACQYFSLFLSKTFLFSAWKGSAREEGHSTLLSAGCEGR